MYFRTVVQALQANHSLRAYQQAAGLPHHNCKAWLSVLDKYVLPHVDVVNQMLATTASTLMGCKYGRNCQQRLQRSTSFSCTILTHERQKERYMTARMLQPTPHTCRTTRPGVPL